MKKRFLRAIGRTVLAAALIVPSVAAVAGLSALGHTQGIPALVTDLDASAAGTGQTIGFGTSTIASAGTMGPGATVNFTIHTKVGSVNDSVTVYLCQCLDKANAPDGVTGDSTTVPGSQCSGGATQLPVDGSLLQCVTDSTGAIVLTYHAPSTPPAQGRADWVGQLSSSPTTKVRAQTHYVYTTVFRFSPSPIAPVGSLAAGSTTPVTLSAEDGLDHGIAGSTVYLSFSGAGSASVGTTALTSTLALFNTASDGTVQITYTAPAVLPTSGQDVLTVQDELSKSKEVNTDSYAFASTTPVVSIGDSDVYEGDQDPGSPANFTVTITPVQPTPTTVQYVTLCGVGDKGCGEDFNQVSQLVTVTIPANTSTTTVLVRQFNYLGGKADSGVGGETYNEGWYVLLSNPSTGILGRSVGEGNLVSDIEGSTVPLGDLYVGSTALVPVNNPIADKVNMDFTVTLGALEPSTVTFSYATSDGTGTGAAIAGTDYTAVSGTGTIPAGKTSFVIHITLLPNSPPLTSKTFTITISNASGGLIIGNQTGTGTVLSS
jgi:hypothetical protein